VSIFERAWGARVPDAEALESALGEHIAAARRTLPEISLDDTWCAEHLARRVAAGEDPLPVLARLRVAELLLTLACAEGNHRAIAAYDERFLRPAAVALVRGGENADAVDEAVQTLRERLFVVDDKIRAFSGAGSLAAWTRVSLSRLHTSLQRSKGKTIPLEDDLPNQIPAADPELAAIRRRYGEPFRAAFRDGFAALTQDDRNVLRLHFVDGLSVGRLAPILGVSRATAGRRLIDARSAALANIVKLLGERLSISPSEIESLIAVLRSTLHEPLRELWGA
jgi:RNA polymerase sigma-70 factor (ECF subfamily)